MKNLEIIIKIIVALVWYVFAWPFINLYRGVTVIWKKLFVTEKPLPVSNASTIAPTKRYKKPKSLYTRWIAKRKSNLKDKRREARHQRRFNLENEF